MAILILVILAIGAIIISAIVSSASRAVNTSRYSRAISNSSGLETIRLLVRRGAIYFNTNFKQRDGETDITIATVTLICQPIVADVFYGCLDQAPLMTATRKKAFDDFAEQVRASYDKEKIISARVFGVVFGILLSKVANTYGKKIKKTVVKRYINNCEIDESYKKEILNITAKFISFDQDKVSGLKTTDGWASRDLGDIAYALLDQKLPKNEYADPEITRCMFLAIAETYKQMDVSDAKDTLIENGLIG